MVGNLGPWRFVDRSHRLKVFADEGLTTVVRADGSTSMWYRGSWSIPRRLRKLGWVHVGDPDSSQGYVFDAYQGAPGATSKMYEVTTPRGEHYQYLHLLEADEKMNNSYVAVSPDGQWMISGEWGAMSRMLIFPTPILNRATDQAGGALRLSGTIMLDRRVRNVQGAAFVGATRLLCATDDQGTDLWPTPRQLLQVDLAAAVTGTTVAAQVSSLGELPTESLCSGVFEVEGIDYDSISGDLRVDVIPPPLCGRLFTTIYRFRPA